MGKVMPHNNDQQVKRTFNPFLYFVKSFMSLFIGAGFVLAACGIALFWWLNSSLPPIKDFSSRVRVPSVTIQAVDGTVIANYGELFEEFIDVGDLPPYVINALLAVEDKRFYAHNGVDIIGLVRAMVQNLRAHRIIQGGSTLTQQLAKNMLISNGFFSIGDRSIRRKLQELILAAKLESRFLKNEILTLYLNRVYFGAATYGIDAASRRYFQKTAKELTLFEAAILAGILCAPSRYSPTASPKKSIERAKLVLTSMEASSFIDASWREHLSEWAESFVQNMTAVSEKGSRYFADWVYENIPSLIGPIDQDLTVVTTLHPKVQHHAEEVCARYYKDFADEYKFSQASAIAMTPSGAVLAMVGGLDYGKSQFNRATVARRQPGSAFKTFVYLAALEAGIDRDEKFDDSAFQQGSWKPGNYKWKELGEISLFEAYVYSVNSVCVRIAKEIGIRSVIKTARRLGITSPLNADLTLALGSPDLTFIELVRAYAPFFNDGYLCWPYGIVEIRDKNGEILYQRTRDVRVRVIEDEPRFTMNTMMRTVIVRGTGRATNVDPNVIGKTGTNSNRDAWFLGGILATPPNVESVVEGEDDDPWVIAKMVGMVIGFWIGNDSREKKMAPHSTGGRLPARMAGDFIKVCLASGTTSKQDENRKVLNTSPIVESSGLPTSVSQLLHYSSVLSAHQAVNEDKEAAISKENEVLSGEDGVLSGEYALAPWDKPVRPSGENPFGEPEDICLAGN
jgi:penicillin-binding protein 1A